MQAVCNLADLIFRVKINQTETNAVMGKMKCKGF
jgi:hypothetical protein